MSSPSVEVLGAHRLPVTDDLMRDQLEILFGDSLTASEQAQAEKRCHEQLSSVVLIEAVVRNRDDTFDVGDFTQPQGDVPESDWQTPWAEAFLTPDGEALAVERWSDPPEGGDLRIAFFMHYWQPDQPLRSSYGDVSCPAVTEMPPRLAQFVPYEPVD